MTIPDIKSCPFCASNKVMYSSRFSGSQYRASVYCDTCHAYGPRILSESVKGMDYQKRRELQNCLILKKDAIEAWNSR